MPSRLLAGVARRDPGLVREVLSTTLPWARFLPTADIDAMAGELVPTMKAAAAIGNTAAVSQMLIEWRHTAEVHADPDLYRALTTQPLDGFRPAAVAAGVLDRIPDAALDGTPTPSDASTEVRRGARATSRRCRWTGGPVGQVDPDADRSPSWR